eukprot:TRINITY_DN494_c0_g2_i1.p1 TRINITY_DN494_c0_g2~~TRINITY_DN494_c0_g2_i1.p1  ORF type:complete len:820 (-),score=147.31 TRINITY_DN494_c0_g2_i1:472-2931(-)
MQRSDSRLKRSLSIRSGSDNSIQRGGAAIQFARITTDSALLQRFLRWSQDNYCQENILFWIAVQDFKKINASDGDKLQKQAKSICDRFIVENSDSQINIDSGTRKAIVAKIQQGPIGHNIFDEAQSHVVLLITSDSIPKFSTSAAFLDHERRNSGQELIPPKLDICAYIVEKNAKEDDAILDFTDEDERTAATLLATGSLDETLLKPRVALACVKVMLTKERESLIPPHIQLFLSIIASTYDKKDREAHFRTILRSLPSQHQAKLYRVLHMLCKLVGYHKSDTVTRIFAPVLLKSSRRARTPSSATLERNANTLALLIESGPDVLRSSEEISVSGTVSPRVGASLLFEEAPVELAKVYAKELKEYGIDLPSPSAELSERDWVLLLTGAQTLTLKPNEILMSPGESYEWFYYVKTGMIHIQRPTTSGKETIISLAPGKSFGELALIADKLAAVCPYCIAAGPEGATLATVSPAFLFQVGEAHPELGRRLSLLLARKLAKNLTMKEQPMKKLSKRAPSVLQFRQEAPEEVRRTEKLVERFDLDKTEVYIRECPAVLISKQKFHGTLGLTRNFVLFFAQVFGFKKKKIIPIRSIQELVYNDEKFEVAITSSALKKTLSFRIDQTHFVEMKPLLASLHQVTVGSQTSPSVAHLSPGMRSAFRTPSTHQLHMSREDWNLLLQGDGALVRYNAGDVVVKMGQEYACMYQLASGSCRIEQEERKGSKVVGTDVLGWLKPGEIFGDISFLIGGSATASVIAEEETSIYVLDTVFLSILFHSDPLLAARLYFYLSEQIGHRLLRNSDNARDKSPARMSRSDRGATTDS